MNTLPRNRELRLVLRARSLESAAAKSQAMGSLTIPVHELLEDLSAAACNSAVSFLRSASRPCQAAGVF